MHDDSTLQIATPTSRRVSRRTLGLLAAAAATTTLGLAAMSTVSGAADSSVDDNPSIDNTTITTDDSIFERGSNAVRDIFTDDDWERWDAEDCPGCGLG